MRKGKKTKEGKSDMISDKYVRFDWAMKRLLRDKANYGVVEGLITTLLGKKIKIQKLLERESNQDSEDAKQNRVDLLAEDEHGSLFLIEVQKLCLWLDGEHEC